MSDQGWMRSEFSLPSNPDVVATPPVQPQHVHPDTLAMAKGEAMRILVVGRFFGQAEQNSAISVDAADLDRVIAGRCIAIRLAITNMLATTQDDLAVELPITSMQDFRPRNWILSIQGMTEAMALRTALQGGDGAAIRENIESCRHLDIVCRAVESALSKITDDNVQPETQAEPRGSEHPSQDALDNVLDMVDMVDSAPPDPADTNTIRSVIREVGRTASIDSTGVSALQAIDAILVRQLAEIQSHPRFVAVRRIWSGLRFLLGALPSGQNRIRVSLLDVAGEHRQRVLHDMAQIGGLTGEADPPDIIVVPAWFGGDTGDQDRLRELAEIGASLHAPVLAAAQPSLFGCVRVEEITKLTDPHLLLEKEHQPSWVGLRDAEIARWLVLAFPDFLIEPATKAGVDRALEPTVEPIEWNLLWGNPVWVIARMIARSELEHGWPCRLTGKDGLIKDIPRTEGDDASALVVRPSVAVCESLAIAGIATLTEDRGRDGLFAPFLPTVRRRHRIPGDDEGQIGGLMASLPFRLLEARLARRIEAWLRRYDYTGEDRRVGIEANLAELISDTGPGGRVSTEMVRDADGVRRICLDVILGKDVLGGPRLEMMLPTGDIGNDAVD